MTISRRDSTPLSAYRRGSIDEQLGRMVESMFEDMLSPMANFPVMGRGAQEGALSPRMAVTETEKSYEVQAELPGVDKDDVKVAIDGRRVNIEAEERQEQNQEGSNTIYTERSYRRYVRSFMLPNEVDDNSAQATLENGILKLSLPKKQASQSKRLTVQ